MTTIRLREGPMKGQYVDTPGHPTDRFLVEIREPVMLNYGDPLDPLVNDTVRRGYYTRTNIVTKRGVPVYQWMGWEGQVIAR